MKIVEGSQHSAQEVADLEIKICELSQEKPVTALQVNDADLLVSGLMTVLQTDS